MLRMSTAQRTKATQLRQPLRAAPRRALGAAVADDDVGSRRAAAASASASTASSASGVRTSATRCSAGQRARRRSSWRAPSGLCVRKTTGRFMACTLSTSLSGAPSRRAGGGATDSRSTSSRPEQELAGRERRVGHARRSTRSTIVRAIAGTGRRTVVRPGVVSDDRNSPSMPMTDTSSRHRQAGVAKARQQAEGQHVVDRDHAGRALALAWRCAPRAGGRRRPSRSRRTRYCVLPSITRADRARPAAVGRCHEAADLLGAAHRPARGGHERDARVAALRSDAWPRAARPR